MTSYTTPDGASLRRMVGAFAAAWARAALAQGAAPGEDGGSALLYLEPFAGADHPRGHPLAARVAEVLRELGVRREAGWARMRLLEEDPVKLQWLREHLPPSPPAEHAPLRVELEEAGPAAAGWGGGAAAALAVVDPPRARGISLEWLRALADLPGASVLLRFPVEEFRRMVQFRGTPLADLPPYGRRLVEGCSALLGDARHGWVVPWTARHAQGDAAGAEAEVVELLAGRLREGVGHEVVVQRLLPAGAAEPEFLLLSTADAELPYHLAEALYHARCDGWVQWEETGSGMVRFERPGELELFGGGGGGGDARNRVVDVVAVANGIADRFAGRTATLAEVLTAMRGVELFRADVRRALLELRRDGRALFRSLAAPDARIAFPRSGAARPGVRGGRRRAESADALSLSLDETE